MKVLLEMFGPPFMRKKEFWIGAFRSAFQGIVMAFVALGFFNAFEKTQQLTWNDQAYQESSFALGSGEWWYVGMGAASGLIIGITKVIWSACVTHIGDELPGLIKELKDLHVGSALQAPCVLLISCMSLAFGASVGPEAALGCCGAALGAITAPCGPRRKDAAALPVPSRGRGKSDALFDPDSFRRVVGNEKTDDSTRLNILTGMSGAMGALFPSPMLSVMLMHELSQGVSVKVLPFMETVVHTGIAASTSYAVFVALEDKTFLKSFHLPVSAEDISHFHVTYMLYAIPLGIVGGIVGLVAVVMLGVLKRIAGSVRMRLNWWSRETFRGDVRIGTILTPCIFGAIYGLLAVAAPLTLGDGNVQLKTIIAKGRSLGAGNLVATAF